MNAFDKLPEGIKYVGVNDNATEYFEAQFPIPQGMSYNSYTVTGGKTAVIDGVERSFSGEWLEKIALALNGREPDFLVIQHMEPDHSGSVSAFAEKYPGAKLVGNAKTFAMLKQFTGNDYTARSVTVADGGTLDLGGRELKFVFAPMVHWPEVMTTYDEQTKTLFSADAFGRFGRTDADIEWLSEARRYYFGIVGKYGMQVQALLKKAAAPGIENILPLHGPALTGEVQKYISVYDKWSSYTPEEEGVLVAYTSVYGNTKKAALYLADKLKEKGVNVKAVDIAECDAKQYLSEAVAQAFRFDKLVIATTTYNAGIFPPMHGFINALAERGFKNRAVGIVENGSWAPMAAKTVKAMLENSKDIRFFDTVATLRSAPDKAAFAALDALAGEIADN
ncbi:MAG: FprA family A-type flavoprotein [Clostridia bacterium]|nr:FprA family A-type flavoprotein [Clostridia bacterium]